MQGAQRRLAVQRRARGAFGRQHFLDDAARAIQRPGDDIEVSGLGVLGVLGGRDLVTLDRQERLHGRPDDFHPLGRVGLPLGQCGKLTGRVRVVAVNVWETTP
jgi:hypothetical protein